MKLEVRCPGCSTCYLVDETAGELLCPSCGSSIAIDPGDASGEVDDAVSAIFDRQQPTAAPVQPAPPAPAVAAPQPPATPAPTTTAVASPAAPVVDEVVCPRCKLHFVPRRAAGTLEPEQRQTVLIVEDMNYFRQVAEDSLSDEYDVRTATTVADARAALDGGGIDLMILDLTLEGGEFGIDVLHGLRTKPCPILIFTAQDESEIYGDTWDELQRLGADDIVIKGMNVGDSLPRKVGALLGKTWDDDD